MRARWKALALTAALALFGTDCLGPVVPIPPPGVDRFLGSACPPALCPPGNAGVIVRVRGLGRLGGLVVVENLTTRLASDGRYVASGYTVPDGMLPPPAEGQPTLGRYDVTLGPVFGDDGAVTAISHVGDRVVVYQYVRDENGELHISQTSPEQVVTAP